MPYKMKNGKWRGKVTICGKVETKVFATKTEAQKWEKEKKGGRKKKKSCDTSHETSTRSVSLLQATNRYLEYSKQRHHPKTFDKKRQCFRMLFEYVPPNASWGVLTPQIALSMMLDKASMVSNYAANDIRCHLGSWYEFCRKFLGAPQPNPFLTCDKLPTESVPHHVPTIEEFWKCVAACERIEDKALLYSLLYTGGRRSEPFRWTWEEDIRLDERKVRLSTCKTAGSNRKYSWLTMPESLHDVLVLQYERTGPKGAVFKTPKKKPYVDCRKHFIEKLCKKIEITPFNYHGVRGLCASILAKYGVPLVEIQHILMHESTTTTDRYIRRLGGTTDVLAESFNKIDTLALNHFKDKAEQKSDLK